MFKIRPKRSEPEVQIGVMVATEVAMAVAGMIDTVRRVGMSIDRAAVVVLPVEMITKGTMDMGVIVAIMMEAGVGIARALRGMDATTKKNTGGEAQALMGGLDMKPTSTFPVDTAQMSRTSRSSFNQMCTRSSSTG